MELPFSLLLPSTLPAVWYGQAVGETPNSCRQEASSAQLAAAEQQDAQGDAATGIGSTQSHLSRQASAVD